MGTSLWVCYH